MRRSPSVKKQTAPLPPSPAKDVLGCWLWYDRMTTSPSAPADNSFEQNVSQSKTLQHLCSDSTCPLEWRHALVSQLRAMWAFTKFPNMTQRRPGRGRPAHYEQDFTFHLCVLHTIVLKLLGENDTERQQSHHWETTAQLLRIFFPNHCREADGWTRERVKARVNLYLREHLDAVERLRRQSGLAEYWTAYGSRKIASVVEARSRAMERLIEYIDAIIADRRAKRTTQAPADSIDLGIPGLVLK